MLNVIVEVLPRQGTSWIECFENYCPLFGYLYGMIRQQKEDHTLNLIVCLGVMGVIFKFTVTGPTYMVLCCLDHL